MDALIFARLEHLGPHLAKNLGLSLFLCLIGSEICLSLNLQLKKTLVLRLLEQPIGRQVDSLVPLSEVA